MNNKWFSRKFIVSVAAFLGSIGASIYGLNTQNNTIATVGIVCSVLSVAIYSAVEAYVDAQACVRKEHNITVYAEKGEADASKDEA